MHRPDRRRSKFVLGSELLESRELLNAHLPHHEFAHVEKQATSSHIRITGTLSGTATYTTDPSNPDAGADSYSLSGSTTGGPATVTGTDSRVEYGITPSSFKDAYYAGNWTMSLGNGSTLAIAYIGTDTEPTGNGPYTSHLKGEAVGTSGPLLGQMFSFTAKGSVSTANGIRHNIFYKLLCELRARIEAATRGPVIKVYEQAVDALRIASQD
jgi:hypothetical protein